MDKIAACQINDYWDPVYKSSSKNSGLILNPDEFYILMSKEFVTVPLDYAAEMRAYDTKVGEFRVHYAGFFDPQGLVMPKAGDRERGLSRLDRTMYHFLLKMDRPYVA